MTRDEVVSLAQAYIENHSNAIVEVTYGKKTSASTGALLEQSGPWPRAATGR
jgi:hypothetical protein